MNPEFERFLLDTRAAGFQLRRSYNYKDYSFQKYEVYYPDTLLGNHISDLLVEIWPTSRDRPAGIAIYVLSNPATLDGAIDTLRALIAPSTPT